MPILIIAQKKKHRNESHTFLGFFILIVVYLIVVVQLIQSYDQRDVDFERAVVHGSKSRRHFCNVPLLFCPHHYFHFH